jgi:integrase
VTMNVAAAVKAPTAGYAKREGQYLTRGEIEALAAACVGEYGDVVLVLALAGLRWGELAGLQVGDRVKVPGEGLRLQRTVMSSKDRGVLFVDNLKSNRSRRVHDLRLRLSVAGGRCGPEGRPAGPRSRLGGDDDGPVRAPDRPEPLGVGEATRGHPGGI